MERIEKIISNREYLNLLEDIEEAEKDRVYCRHNMEHFLDVSRIAYILVLEKGLDIKKDIVYAAGLLHDIGKRMQYDYKIPHEKASAEIAPAILEEAGYTEEEIQFIVETILSHRVMPEDDIFHILFYKADKMSRNCFCCKFKESCNWEEDTKNKGIII